MSRPNDQFEVYRALPGILAFANDFDGQYVRRMIDDPANAHNVMRYNFCDLWWPGSGIVVRAGPWIGTDSCRFTVGFNGFSVVPVRLLQETHPRRGFDRIRFLAQAMPHEPERSCYLLFDVLDGARYWRLRKPVVVSATLTAFALDLLVEPPGAHTGTRRPKFMPYGLHTYNRIQQPSCFAAVSGLVSECRPYVNPMTGSKFQWALVETSFGQIDVVTNPETIHGSEIVPGARVHTLSAWMTGRLPDALGSPAIDTEPE